ncbi:MAG: methyltransferase domain-containing protein [Candidatus Dormibacteraeota bacterium]|nr:methyltransferase domain-containing protein [Candidatus Dormibacteraeota bacterium]
MSDRLRARAESFGAAAAAYERGRPPYPDAAVDWLLPPKGGRVLDLGAGTGKLTRQLQQRGLEVVAVEPSAGMREQLASALPGVRLLDGTAEAIPLPASSVDAVLVAQAWHWVEPDRALPEVARVLAPGGRLGLVWNVRDERIDWVKRLGQTMHGDEDRRAPAPVVAHPFATLQRHDVEWSYHTDRDGLVDLVASRSYVITLPEPQRRAVLDDVRRLLAAHPELAGAQDIAVPYVTECYRTELMDEAQD